MSNSQRSVGLLLTTGAATFAVYVLTHPQGSVDDATNVKEAVHSMAVESAWVPSHLIGLAALALIGTSLWRLLRSGWLEHDRRARAAGWLLLAGTLAAAVELVPHMLVSSETSELAGGGPTPVTDLHLLF